MARRLLWASLVLVPIDIAARYAFHADDTTLFVLSAAALIPLAWLVGEATEQASEHTGAGIGGFLNASFGNAPELIISVIAISDGLPNVVRGSLAGSVVSNLLLVLGAAMLVGGNARERLDLRSLLPQLGVVFVAVLLFLVPSIPGFHGNPDRHSLAVLSVPVAIVLLGLYLATTIRNLRRHGEAHTEEAAEDAWSLRRSLVTLALATLAVAVVSEILVHSLTTFAKSTGLSQFFISVVIVAIVGNAAEHGGAIIIAHRGKMKLATEIAVSSSAQVAVFVVPVVALVSWAVKPPLSLAFRPQELIGMGGAAAIVAIVIRDARSTRWRGVLLTALYVAFAAWILASPDR